MVSIRKKSQIKSLAKACKKAFIENPERWIDEKAFNDEAWSIFDFPDYGGLPKKVCEKLSSDCVDVIQEYTFDLAGSGHRRFSKVKLEKLLIEYAEYGYEIP